MVTNGHNQGFRWHTKCVQMRQKLVKIHKFCQENTLEKIACRTLTISSMDPISSGVCWTAGWAFQVVLLWNAHYFNSVFFFYSTSNLISNTGNSQLHSCQIYPNGPVPSMKPEQNGGHFNGLVQDCSNSSALAMELLQSCTKPSILQITFSVAFLWKQFLSVWFKFYHNF